MIQHVISISKKKKIEKKRKRLFNKTAVILGDGLEIPASYTSRSCWPSCSQ